MHYHQKILFGEKLIFPYSTALLEFNSKKEFFRITSNFLLPYSTNRQCQYFTPDIFGEKRTENVLSVIYAF